MRSGAENVTVDQVDRLITDGAVLLDVREADEWARGHAPQAVHVPLSELGDRLGEVPADRPVLAICHGGGRSGRVTEALTQRGYDVRNVTGGMSAWEQAGLPVVDNEGGPGQVD